jgi:hypothetical protein
VSNVVVDENVYIRGLYAERTEQEADILAARLLQCLQVGHRWVLSRPILAAYYRQFKKHASTHGRIESALTRSLRDILLDSDAHVMLPETQQVPGLYDHDDDHMVEAAAAVPGCALITLDGRLRDALITAGIPGQFGFEVLDVRGAWERMCEPLPQDRT